MSKISAISEIDCRQNKKTGDEIAKEIFKIKPDIMLILCAGHSDLINEEKAKSIGIKAYVKKPVSIDSLAETIRYVLDTK